MNKNINRNINRNINNDINEDMCSGLTTLTENSFGFFVRFLEKIIVCFTCGKYGIYQYQSVSSTTPPILCPVSDRMPFTHYPAVIQKTAPPIEMKPPLYDTGP
jgi:hypothetical protein